MIGGGLALQQGVAPDLAPCVGFAHPRLFLVGDAGRHRTRWSEGYGQMPECEGADEQAGHDLIADAQQHRRVEHVVAERDGGRQGDHVSREQRQLHARLPLSDTIAHRRNAACDLRRRANLPRCGLDQVGVGLKWLMR